MIIQTLIHTATIKFGTVCCYIEVSNGQSSFQACAQDNQWTLKKD